MKLSQAQLLKVIDDLQGTNGCLSDCLPEGVNESDLTEDQLAEIDVSVFKCETCDWWFEAAEEGESTRNGERQCLSCGEAG